MAEPVTLEEAKSHLRVLDTNEDGLITSLIVAAREWVENYTGQILVQRAIEQPFDRFTAYLQLHHRPVVSVEGVTYTDTDGDEQTIADHVSTLNRYPVRVYPALNSWWPSTQTNTIVTVNYTAGYEAGEVPQSLIQAMLLLIGHWFDTRSGVNIGNIVSEVPMAVESLCNPYRSAVI